MKIERTKSSKVYLSVILEEKRQIEGVFHVLIMILLYFTSQWLKKLLENQKLENSSTRRNIKVITMNCLGTLNEISQGLLFSASFADTATQEQAEGK